MLKIWNTLTRNKDVFRPIREGHVRMYTCGPTVYDFAHIGNFRAYICADLLRRYLEFSGYKVTQVMNLTDVDDKTIRNSQKEGVSLKDFTDRYIQAFFEDVDTLNIERAAVYPRATETISEMVEIVKKLERKGIAYRGEDGSWYYRIDKFPDYGKLSRIRKDELKAGARVKQDEYDKSSVSDFALWKAWDEDDGDVFWNTELGKGRPGWHIECSAMSMKYLGSHFDIHTGGIDLIFPHHENEIAQSEGCCTAKFVNYWVHNEWLLVDGKKMSKSLGNFYTLRDLLRKGYDPRAIRYHLLSTHYKVQLNFTEEGLKAAKASVERLQEFVDRLKSVADGAEGPRNDRVEKLIAKHDSEFRSAMDDDLNISVALASVFEFVKEINKMIDEGSISEGGASRVIEFMKRIDKVLGVLKFEDKALEPELMELIKKREDARRRKEWDAADKIRDELREKGIELLDTPQGTRWKRI